MILVLEHDRECPAALFADWAHARGWALRTVTVAELERWPDPADVDVVVSLGSDHSVHASPEPWIAREIEFLREAHEADVPVLGICFGAQALAKALGGEVTRAPKIEIEWAAVQSRDAALIPPGPWLRWHEDTFSVPPAAQVLANVGELPLAFVQRTAVGIQFHPEVDAEIVDLWIEGSRRRLAEEPIDVSAVGREVRAAEPGARERAYELFDGIARLWQSPPDRLRQG